MASTDALPVARKNVAYRLTFPIYKNDGTLITGATALDSEVSKDAGTFADCTNEATEIATASGVYYLDLTSTEMNADCVAVIVKTSSTGAVIPSWTLYPQETGDIKVDVTSLLGTAWLTPGTAGTPDVNVKLWNGLTTVALPLIPTTAGRTLDVSAGGEAGVDWANVGTPGSTVSLSATTVATVTTTTTATTATNLTNLPTIPANWLTAAGTAADFGAEMATAIWTDTTAGDFTAALSIGKTIVNGVALGTGLTINAYTGNTVQTGDSFARIGATGSGLTSLASQASVDDLPTNAELATSQAAADDATLAAIAALNNLSAAAVNAEVDTALADVGLTTTITGRIDAAVSTRATPAQILTTALTEAYAADNAAGTLSQILFAIQAFLQERAVSGTTLTVKKLDGTTAAMTFTLSDPTSPISITRAT